VKLSLGKRLFSPLFSWIRPQTHIKFDETALLEPISVPKTAAHRPSRDRIEPLDSLTDKVVQPVEMPMSFMAVRIEPVDTVNIAAIPALPPVSSMSDDGLTLDKVVQTASHHPFPQPVATAQKPSDFYAPVSTAISTQISKPDVTTVSAPALNDWFDVRPAKSLVTWKTPWKHSKKWQRLTAFAAPLSAPTTADATPDATTLDATPRSSVRIEATD
jgi:hypothetical protein